MIYRTCGKLCAILKHICKGEKTGLKPNYIGILGAIIALISIALPWWTLIMSTSVIEISYSLEAILYLYQSQAKSMGVSTTFGIDTWYCWAALALIVIGCIMGIIGSISAAYRKMLLILGGIIILLAPIIFASGLSYELSRSLVMTGAPQVGLFSSGSVASFEVTFNYSSYLTYGFWLALVGAIIVIIAAFKKTEKASAEPAAIPT